MSIETEALALFEEGNPVPDLEALDPVNVDAAAYLATLQQRSSEVIELDEKAEPREEQRTGRLVAAVAAVAVIIAGVFVILVNQGNETPPVTEPPATTSTVAQATMDPTGFWQLGSTRRLHLGEDGTFAWIVAGSVRDRGVWEQEVDTIMFQSDADSRACQEGDAATYLSEMPDSDTLTLTLESDDCTPGRNIVQQGVSQVFERTDGFEVPEPPSPEEAAWEALPLLNAPAGELARLPNFDPVLAFDSDIPLVPGVGPGANDFTPLFLNSQADQPVALVFIRRDGSSVAEQQEFFTDPEAFEVSEIEELTVDTAEGVRTRFTVLTLRSIPNSVQAFPLLSGEEYISYIFDVAGRTVLLLGNVDVVDSDTFDDLATSIIWKDVGQAP